MSPSSFLLTLPSLLGESLWPLPSMVTAKHHDPGKPNQRIRRKNRRRAHAAGFRKAFA